MAVSRSNPAAGGLVAAMYWAGVLIATAPPLIGGHISGPVDSGSMGPTARGRYQEIHMAGSTGGGRLMFWSQEMAFRWVKALTGMSTRASRISAKRSVANSASGLQPHCRLPRRLRDGPKLRGEGASARSHPPRPVVQRRAGRRVVDLFFGLLLNYPSVVFSVFL